MQPRTSGPPSTWFNNGELTITELMCRGHLCGAARLSRRERDDCFATLIRAKTGRNSMIGGWTPPFVSSSFACTPCAADLAAFARWLLDNGCSARYAQRQVYRVNRSLRNARVPTWYVWSADGLDRAFLRQRLGWVSFPLPLSHHFPPNNHPTAPHRASDNFVSGTRKTAPRSALLTMLA